LSDQCCDMMESNLRDGETAIRYYPKLFFIAVSLVLALPVYAQRATGSGTDLAARKLTYDVVSIRSSNLEGMSINSRR
jgi:hypothetical protein